ncbi:MAG: hypothetical protein ACI883_001052 [Candidatus Azotimanducaceae bacterium]
MLFMREVMNEQNKLQGQQEYEQGDVFPVFYLAEQKIAGGDIEQACIWVDANREKLSSQLTAHGAILLRGFGIYSDQDFDQLIRRFAWPNFTYADSLSNAVRRNRSERVFTANEAPADVSIFLHHEMAQTPVYPSRLLFYCEQAADTGGATPICRSDMLLEGLRRQAPEFVAQCVAKGVRYSQTMPLHDDLGSGQGRSWSSTLSAPTQSDAETKLTKLGYTWSWQKDQSLSVTTPVLPAVRELADGRSVFFNQLIAAFRGWKDARNSGEKSISFGDGTSIQHADMAVAIKLADELSFDIPWQTGDVALVDNFLVMHGRRPFTGTRKVLASLVA